MSNISDIINWKTINLKKKSHNNHISIKKILNNTNRTI